MYKITYSQLKNRIFIEIYGVLSPEEKDEYKRTAIATIDDAKNDFTVFVDLVHCDINVLMSSDEFQVIRDYGTKKGVKAVACVLNSYCYEMHKQKTLSSLKNVFLDANEAEIFLNKI